MITGIRRRFARNGSSGKTAPPKILAIPNATLTGIGGASSVTEVFNAAAKVASGVAIAEDSPPVRTHKAIDMTKSTQELASEAP
jgi:hypothetical protein